MKNLNTRTKETGSYSFRLVGVLIVLLVLLITYLNPIGSSKVLFEESSKIVENFESGSENENENNSFEELHLSLNHFYTVFQTQLESNKTLLANSDFYFSLLTPPPESNC